MRATNSPSRRAEVVNEVRVPLQIVSAQQDECALACALIDYLNNRKLLVRVRKETNDPAVAAVLVLEGAALDQLQAFLRDLRST